jgi:hypothetical protein
MLSIVYWTLVIEPNLPHVPYAFSAQGGAHFCVPILPFSSQTSGPCITDFHPAERDNVGLIGAVYECASLPRRPSKLPQTHFQRSLTS